MIINNYYHHNLKDKFDFKEHCARKSVDIFEEAYEQGIYPSRKGLFVILIKDVVYSPFFLVGKIGEIVLNVFNDLLSLDKPWHIFFKVIDLPQYSVFFALQFTLPFLFTAIRISSTVLGLLVPPLALLGWKFAENGEVISSRLWPRDTIENVDEKDLWDAFEEIVPSSAIYYLGEKKARNFSRDVEGYDPDDLREAIMLEFSLLLYEIYQANPDCFRDLLSYNDDQKLNPHNPPLIEHMIGAASDIKQILFDLEKSYFEDYESREALKLEKKKLVEIKDKLTAKQLMLLLEQWKQKKEVSIKKLDACYREEIPKLDSLKKMERIFSHLCLNLELPLSLKNLPPNILMLKPRITLIKDLFSQRKRFGRAHFKIPLHHLDTHLFKSL